MAQGEFALVNQHLSLAMQKPPIGWNPVGEHEILVLMTDTAAVQHDAAALTRTAERADTLSRQLDHPLYHAISLRALGTLDGLNGNHAQGEAHFLEALKIFQRLETHWQAGRTLFDLAEMLAAQGKNHAAAAYYHQAEDEFKIMQAQPFLERARAVLESIAHK